MNSRTLRQPTCWIVTDGMESPHGTEMLTALLVRELVARDWHVELWATRHNRRASAWEGMLHELDVPVHHPHFWFGTARYWPHKVAVRMMWRAHAKRAPDLIWSPSNDFFTSHALLTRGGIRTPFFVHDPNEAGPQCPHYHPDWFRACHLVAGLSVHGARQMENARSYYKLEAPVEIVWPSSMPPQREVVAPPLGKSLRFGQLGRQATMKGTLFAIAAFAQVIQAGREAELHLHGDGPLRGAGEELASSLGVQNLVTFYGAYDWRELDDAIDRFDVGLMPSTYEGFGLVMLEMMSRMRPVIASDVGSSREVLEGKGGGWVVSRADTATLVAAMIQACDDRALTMAKAEEARRVWTEWFTPAAMADRYFGFWQRCAPHLALIPAG